MTTGRETRFRYTKVAIVALVLAAISAPASATITFEQLDDDVFVVSHRVKLIGSRGKAMEMVYTKAASLCVAAGFTHYKVLEQESEAAQEDDAANATVQVQFYLEDGEGRLDCERKADPEYVHQAAQKLDKRGYTPPAARSVAEGSDSSPGGGSGETDLSSSGCTLEQVAAMARAGLSDEQIRAACAEGS